METKRHASWLDLTLGDRVLLGVFSPVVTMLLLSCGIALFAWKPTDTWMKIVRLLLQEATVVTAFFSGLVSIWVIAQPRWVRTLLEKRLMRTLVCALATAASLAVLLILAVFFG